MSKSCKKHKWEKTRDFVINMVGFGGDRSTGELHLLKCSDCGARESVDFRRKV